MFFQAINTKNIENEHHYKRRFLIDFPNRKKQKTMAGRAARRTRVYNASYNIGENYYKSALDGIDRKYSGAPAR